MPETATSNTSGFRNLSSGICGLALLIIGIVVIFILAVWLAIWYFIERIQVIIENNPVTKVVITISGLFVITNNFVRALVDFTMRRIDLVQVKARIDKITDDLRVKLEGIFSKEKADKDAGLFKRKFDILVQLIDEGKTDVPPELMTVNQEIAHEIFPAFETQVATILSDIDNNIIDLAASVDKKKP